MSGEKETTPRRTGLLALALFLVTLLLYAPVGGHAFVAYDDDVYVTENPEVRAGLSLAGTRWALGTGHAANWHPLTWVAHMLDVELFGLDAGAHHRTSACLHALTAAILFVALVALTGARWSSALAAALFALHPLRVESVAWVAERKDVLAGLLACTSLWAYAVWARAPGRLRYAAVAASLALGLMAKPTLVALPFGLLLLDRWPLRRTEPLGRLLREKAPLFALVAVSSIVTLLVQRAGGALDPLDRLGFGARLANAFVAVTTYARATLWPTGLACYYPHPGIVLAEGYRAWNAAAIGALLSVSLASGAALALRARAPWLFVGWFWFLGMLVPVLGLVQVGLQSHADRYTYLPSIGLAIVAAFGCRSLVGAQPRTRGLVVGGAVLCLSALALATRAQLRTWRDGTTLFTHAVSVTERNFLAHNNLGSEFERAGDWEAARAEYRLSVAARPGVAPVHYNLGVVNERLGERAAALRAFRQAIALWPDYPAARTNLGLLLSRQGDDAEAVRHLTRAWELDPTLLPAGQALAWVLATSPEPGVVDGERAVEIALLCLGRSDPAPPALEEVAAAALAVSGRFEEAVRLQRRVVERIPADLRGPAVARLAEYENRRPHVKSP